MGKVMDITGMKFGRLTVIKRVEDHVMPSGEKRSRWLCKCDCGCEKITLGSYLSRGLITHCGCDNKCKKKKDANNNGSI